MGEISRTDLAIMSALVTKNSSPSHKSVVIWVKKATREGTTAWQPTRVAWTSACVIERIPKKVKIWLFISIAYGCGKARLD